MTAVAVGVDPGGSYIGIVARVGDELLACGVADAGKLIPPLVAADPVARRHRWAQIASGFVADTLDHVVALYGLGDPHQAILRRELVLGVENVTKPHPYGGRVSGQARVIDAGPILDTAVILGVLLGCWPDLTLVQPRRNGAAPAATYPERIRPRARDLGGPSIHARSAWDVAGVAAAMVRLTARGAA